MLKVKSINQRIYSDEDLIQAVKAVQYNYLVEPVGELARRSRNIRTYTFLAFDNQHDIVSVCPFYPVYSWFKNGWYSTDQIQVWIDNYILQKGKPLIMDIRFVGQRGLELLYSCYEKRIVHSIINEILKTPFFKLGKHNW